MTPKISTSPTATSAVKLLATSALTLVWRISSSIAWAQAGEVTLPLLRGPAPIFRDPHPLLRGSAIASHLRMRMRGMMLDPIPHPEEGRRPVSKERNGAAHDGRCGALTPADWASA